MRAAFRLRLLEARRRGGLWMLPLAAALVLLVGRLGGETPDGRYGLASDLAVTLGYLAAVFYGAFPLAVDRERKRSYLPSASPVTPWTWALGNALGAAAVVGLLTFVLFAAAGLGAAAGGGVPTHAVQRISARGLQELPFAIETRAEAKAVRLLFRTYLKGDPVGAPDFARVEVDGRVYEVYPEVPITVPVSQRRFVMRNRSPEYAVALVPREFRALGEERSFLANAAAAGVAPALGAAALAALATAAGANLSAPVAALLAAVLLFLASLKGFLFETFDYEGIRAEAQAAGEARVVARAVVKTMLWPVPEIGELDHSGAVAIGDWTGFAGAAWALALLAISLALAFALGGLGVHLRRIP